MKHEFKGRLREGIEVVGERTHSKASEAYLDVVFHYKQAAWTWEGSVPIEERRTGISAGTPEEKAKVLNWAYDEMHPSKHASWLKEQELFWSSRNKKVTQSLFDALKGSLWECVNCLLTEGPLQGNRNWARRWQDIKEFGYLTATNTKRFCINCQRNSTQLILLKTPRGSSTGYETWSPKLRKKILEVLDNRDVYEDQKRNYLLPDHKFPEIRWDEDTLEENRDDMTEAEIRAKFQLLSNQRNQQKREVCRECSQTGQRGAPFGIPFYYQGEQRWPIGVPEKGRQAESGCVGCGWYDLETWRRRLKETLTR